MYSQKPKSSLFALMVATLLLFGQEGFAQQGKVTIRVDEFSIAEAAKPYLQNINFQDLLKAELTKIGKFEAVKRDDLRGNVEEIQNSKSSLFDPNTAQSLGGFKSAQLAIGGSLDLIDRQKSQGMKKQYTARANIKITVITNATDANRTAEITDYVQSPADLFGPLAVKLARDLSLSKYPIKIAAVDGTSAVLNYGSSVLKQDDTLAFYDLAEIKDPDTGAVISQKSKRAGTLRVTSVDETSASAEIIDGQPGVGTVCQMEAAASATTPVEGSTSSTSRSAIPVTGEKPTLSIGKFKYSNEFDLSQTADRNGKPITSAGAGQGSGGVLGALAGALIAGGDTANKLGGAAVGALAGQTVDSERRQYEHGSDPQGAQMPSDQKETAIEKESQVLREMTITKAHKSGRFTIVEQTRTNEIKGQMNNEQDGDYDPSGLIERGKMKTAKYTAFGTLTRFETDRKQKGFSIAGGNESLTMKITLDLRLVDNELGTVVCGDTVTGSISTESSQVGLLGFGTASENQGAIGSLLDDLSKNVVAKIVNTLWPILIIQVNADEKVVMINAGETVVSRGQRLTVYSQGAQVVDPYSGEVLGSQESTVGEIEVFEATPRFSKCKIIRPIQQVQIIQTGQVCRASVTIDSDQPANANAPESKPKFTF